MPPPDRALEPFYVLRHDDSVRADLVRVSVHFVLLDRLDTDLDEEDLKGLRLLRRPLIRRLEGEVFIVMLLAENFARRRFGLTFPSVMGQPSPAVIDVWHDSPVENEDDVWTG